VIPEPVSNYKVKLKVVTPFKARSPDKIYSKKTKNKGELNYHEKIISIYTKIYLYLLEKNKEITVTKKENETLITL
jgi:hypothetical protein